MTSDPILELSVEQLVRALNNKLFMECTRVQSTISPASTILVATLAAEVRSNELKANPRVLTRPFAGRRSGETSQRHSTRDYFLEERPTTCEPSPSRGHRAVRHLHLQYRSPTDHLLDPRLPILAQSDQFQPQELGIDRQWLEAIGPIVSRTRRGSPSRS
jgi:hypothetical protein